MSATSKNYIKALKPEVLMINTLMTTQDKAVRQQVIFPDSNIGNVRDFKVTLWLKTTKVMTMPKFSKKQKVGFVGGTGTIKNCLFESGTWTYAVEMELGPEPEMGRVGSETTVLFDETDIHQVM